MTLAAVRRAEAVRARMDTRDWAKARRERTRKLIELGGLITKSGLPELIAAIEQDDRAVILGALLELAESLRERADDPSRRTRVTGWRDRGRAALRVGTPTGEAK